MASEIERITRLLEKTFDKQPWYGSSIMETLSDIIPDIISKHQGETHSILELVMHMTAWRQFAIKRLQGDADFEITEDLNFPVVGTWEEAIKNLQTSQRILTDEVKKFSENRLGDLVPSKRQKYTYYTLLHGIIQHDIYHLGQIALLKKSLSRSDA